MIESTQTSGIVCDLMAMAGRPDSLAILAQIACPTLVIVGELDLTTPLSDAKIMADTIPGARLAVIPGAGHLANLEQPDRFTRLVRSFASELAEKRI